MGDVELPQTELSQKLKEPIHSRPLESDEEIEEKKGKEEKVFVCRIRFKYVLSVVLNAPVTAVEQHPKIPVLIVFFYSSFSTVSTPNLTSED